MSLAQWSWFNKIVASLAPKTLWRGRQAHTGRATRLMSIEPLEDRTVLSAMSHGAGHLAQPLNLSNSAHTLPDQHGGPVQAGEIAVAAHGNGGDPSAQPDQHGGPVQAGAYAVAAHGNGGDPSAHPGTSSTAGDPKGNGTSHGSVDTLSGGVGSFSSGKGYPVPPAQNPAPQNDQLIPSQQTITFNSLRPDTGSLLANASRIAGDTTGATQAAVAVLSGVDAGRVIVVNRPALINIDTQALAQATTATGLLGESSQHDAGNPFLASGGDTVLPSPATLKTLEAIEHHWPTIVDTLFQARRGEVRTGVDANGVARHGGREVSAAVMNEVTASVPAQTSGQPALALDSRPETLVVASALEGSTVSADSPTNSPAAPVEQVDVQAQNTRLLTGLVVSVLFASGAWKATWRTGQHTARDERRPRLRLSPLQS